MARGTLKKLAVALLAAGACSTAYADPGTFALLVAALPGVSTAVSFTLTLFAVAYGAAEARSQRRRAEAQAKAAYNSSLTERNITALTASPPWRIIYGRCNTGGDIISVFTTNKSSFDDSGNAYTKPDAYKHLVIHFATHEVQAFNDVFLDGKSVGLSTLDVNGWSTVSDFSKTRKTYRNINLAPGASETFPYSGSVISLIDSGTLDYGGMNGVSYTLTNGNKTVTNTGAQTAWLSFIMDEPVSSVRVSVHSGTTTQTVDTYLNGVIPSKWTTEHRLRGLAYIVLTLDLEDPRFQGGPPQTTADISGRKVFDTRTSTTAWSDNNALCINDYLISPWGPGVTQSDVNTTYCNAAANVCGTAVTARKRINGVINNVSQARYTFNGVITTDDSREAILDEFADSMAGWVVNGSQWLIMAGAWSASVLPLGEDDLDGQIEVLQGDVPLEDLFNGVRGQFIPKLTSVPIDFTPYKNAAFVTSDGKNLWKNKNLPFTDDPFIATTIARVMTERSRNGLVITFPAKLKAYGLQIGDRVSVTSAEHGFSSKAFRVTDWQYASGAPVLLTLQEDDPAAYDLADEANADATPNTGLPSPWVMPDIAGLALLSDATTLRRQSDGLVAPRVKVSWNSYTGPYVNDGSGSINIKYQRAYRDGTTGAWISFQLPGNSTSTFIEGVTDGDRVTVGVWAQNSVQAISNTAFAQVTVVGKVAAPSNVAGLAAVSAPGRINLSWTDCADVDYEDTELRTGASWAAGTRIFKGKASAYSHPQSTPLSVTIFAKHFDRWGNESVTAASVSSSSLSQSADENWAFSNGTADGWSGISSVVQNAGASGGYYGIASGISTPAVPRPITIDVQRKYRVSVRVRAVGGTGPVYAGVIPYDINGSHISNTLGGTYPYPAASGFTLPADE